MAASSQLTVKESSFGHMNSVEVTRIDLGAPAAGITASFITYGATLLSLRTPDKDGAIDEITLQYPDLVSIMAGSYYYGATCGRVANRIAGARFTLDGREYVLAANNGANALHGGLRGFDKVIWSHQIYSEDTEVGVRFSHVSPDGDEGYPGTLTAEVTYALDASGALLTRFRATVEQFATPCNLTNHTYWNLSGGCRKSILGHTLQLNGGHFLPVDGNQIPTGELEPVAGTAFDFREAKELAAPAGSIDGGGRPGLDHCFVVDGCYDVSGGGGGGGGSGSSGGNGEDDRHAPRPAAAAAAGGGGGSSGSDGKDPLPLPLPLRLVAELADPASGRTLRLLASQPGLQVYTANWVGDDTSLAPHRPHHAVCLETQAFPDAVNRPNKWASSVLLRPGHVYEQRARHEFGVVSEA